MTFYKCHGDVGTAQSPVHTAGIKRLQCHLAPWIQATHSYSAHHMNLQCSVRRYQPACQGAPQCRAWHCMLPRILNTAMPSVPPGMSAPQVSTQITEVPGMYPASPILAAQPHAPRQDPPSAAQVVPTQQHILQGCMQPRAHTPPCTRPLLPIPEHTPCPAPHTMTPAASTPPPTIPPPLPPHLSAAAPGHVSEPSQVASNRYGYLQRRIKSRSNPPTVPGAPGGQRHSIRSTRTASGDAYILPQHGCQSVFSSQFPPGPRPSWEPPPTAVRHFVSWDLIITAGWRATALSGAGGGDREPRNLHGA